MDKIAESVRTIINLLKLLVGDFRCGGACERAVGKSQRTASAEKNLEPRDTEMTRKLMALALGGAAALMASPALADGYKAKAAPVACCEANWNGIYFGGGVGWGAMITDHSDRFGPT